MVLVTSSAAVFACHSAACAPPSAGGTGGSKSGRSGKGGASRMGGSPSKDPVVDWMKEKKKRSMSDKSSDPEGAIEGRYGKMILDQRRGKRSK